LATDSVARTSRKGRPNYSIDFKRQLAAQACEPSVSVAKLALKHGINANMLFKWRRQYRAGRFGTAAEDAALSVPMKLLPVVTATPPKKPEGTAAAREPVIEIAIGDVTVRLRGEVNPMTLGTVLDCLARRR